MSAAIVDLSQQPAPETLSSEICIIGSGCGGATAAWALSEAGHEVVVLEEGADRTGPQLTQRDGPMYDQLYMDRGGRATSDLAIAVLQGRVLGGGGVINACDVVPMTDELLEYWGRRHGLTELAPQAIRPYAERALADLSAGPIPDSMANRANELLRIGTEKRGLRGELMMHNRVDCDELGTCLIGCPVDAKRNPRFVAIPGSIASGARYYTRARAVRIDDGDREVKRITVRTLDPLGYHERDAFEVRARIVILAANAVGSTLLLLRSGLGNEHVGRHLSLQPQLPLLAVFDEELEAFAGIPQAYAVTEFEEHHEEHGLWGFRIEAIMGTPGIIASLIPYPGAAGKAAMARYPRLAASLLLVPDEPSGRVEASRSGRPVIRYEHRESHKARAREAIRQAARIYLAAGAKQVEVPVTPPLIVHREADLAQTEGLSFPPVTAPWLSAHQQGGVRMAPSPRDGACDPDGQVHGCRDVFVFDSAWFPSSASSHIMAPILTLSRYLSERLAARLG